MSIRIEVKYKGGRFVPFGKDLPNVLPVDGARYYVTNVSKADYILVPGVIRRRSVEVCAFTKEQVLEALDRLEGNASFGVLSIVQGQVKLMGVELMDVIHTFGPPAFRVQSGLAKVADLKPDESCRNAPYARAWEKVCAKAVGGKWVGALKGVQVDIIINEADD
jgi:hypothetical protein